ncbi:SDR family NAD(P)-dependent oxidoreductase [Nocardia jinanensis]|uniref:SDR family oxidoreductase n=1 Tax=Nocardia jinanensis TaxID=382504 RepID=A0A917VTI4_9NOCA|nr:SDR family oxidoreductase [Nocardia jinanensis]GGL12646.1 hypothetical protein GCM10011588_28840 [Nocardia jinanensis]
MNVVVVGATGDVGYGVVARCLARGWPVTAVGRRPEALAALADEKWAGSAPLRVHTGSIADDAAAAALRDEIDIGRFDAVVLAVSTQWPGRPLAETDYADLSTFFGAYLRAHLAAAKAFLPAMSADSRFIGIGGGMADFVVPGLVPVSMMQAAQRMLYRGLHQENKGSGIEIREVMVVSKVNGRSNRAGADPRWLTDSEIGEHVCAVIAAPAEFAGPVLRLESPRTRRTER